MLRIVALPGDGVGPEVIAEARRVLEALSRTEGFELAWTEFPCGGKYWKETGREWPVEAYPACKEADAVLHGAVGWPGAVKPDGEVAGGGVLFGLRLGLDLYANVRPCKLYPGVRHRISGGFRTVWDPATVDMVLVRENTEGEYVPIKGYLERAESRELAIDVRVITRKGALRVIEKAFELAQARKASGGRGKVTCVDKSNVLAGCRLFRACFEEVGARYPGIARATMYIDAFCHALVRAPEDFDVVVLTNLQGDVATDLAAALQGGMGMAASANLGDRHAMFEPVHGSAPDIAGTGRANPLAAVDSARLLLEHQATREPGGPWGAAARRLERAVAAVLEEGKAIPADLGGTASCRQVGEAIVARLAPSGERGART